VVYALFPDVIVVVTVAADVILAEELIVTPVPAWAPEFDVAAARPFAEEEVVVEFAETARFCVATDEEATLDDVVVDW